MPLVHTGVHTVSTQRDPAFGTEVLQRLIMCWAFGRPLKLCALGDGASLVALKRLWSMRNIHTGLTPLLAKKSLHILVYKGPHKDLSAIL